VLWMGHALARLFASAGDVNGDGYSDVIVGLDWLLRGTKPKWHLWTIDVYYGSSSGVPTSPSWSAIGDRPNTQFGYSAARPAMSTAMGTATLSSALSPLPADATGRHLCTSAIGAV